MSLSAAALPRGRRAIKWLLQSMLSASNNYGALEPIVQSQRRLTEHAASATDALHSIMFAESGTRMRLEDNTYIGPVQVAYMGKGVQIQTVFPHLMSLALSFILSHLASHEPGLQAYL